MNDTNNAYKKQEANVLRLSHASADIKVNVVWHMAYIWLVLLVVKMADININWDDPAMQWIMASYNAIIHYDLIWTFVIKRPLSVYVQNLVPGYMEDDCERV